MLTTSLKLWSKYGKFNCFSLQNMVMTLCQYFQKKFERFSPFFHHQVVIFSQKQNDVPNTFLVNVFLIGKNISQKIKSLKYIKKGFQ